MMNVAKERGVKNNFAAHKILELHFYFRHLEADDLRRFPSGAGVSGSGRCILAAILRKHRLALRFDVFLAAVTIIRIAALDQLSQIFL